MQVQKTRQGYKLVKSNFGRFEEIPEEWQLSRIDSFLKINMGQSPPSESYNEEGKGLPFFQGVTDFGDLYPEPKIWCTDTRKIAESNQILFSVRAPVGEINLTNSKCCIGRGIASLTPTNSDLRYCFYLLKQFKNSFIKYSQGTTYDAINRDEIVQTKLIYTKIFYEQQKIASILSNVDSLIQHTQKVIEQTQGLKKGLMQKLLTKGIGHTKFKKTKFGEIPENWKIIKLDEICLKITDGTHFSPPNFKQGDFMYLTSKNIRSWGIDLSNITYVSKEIHQEIYKRCGPVKDDVLYVKDGVGTGLAVINDLNIQFSMLSSVALLRPNKSILDAKYLIQYLNHTPVFQRITGEMIGTAIKRLTLEMLKTIKIILPPLDEQIQISSILVNIDNYILKSQDFKSHLETLKKGLMQKLLTGQIRVKL